jgi:sporulation-control protein
MKKVKSICIGEVHIMGIINKIMANVGIGSASVDTVIENPRVIAGNEVKGYINIKGGKMPQNIDDIYLYVMTKVEKQSNNIRFTGKDKIQQVILPVAKTISAGEKIKIPFNFILNKQAPMTTLRTPVWIHTGLDIKSAVDPKDNDSLQISAHPYFQTILDAIERLELVIYKVTNVEDYYYSSMSFLQKIEFRPTGSFKYELGNLKLMYILLENKIELIMDVNKSNDEISLEDKKIRLSISYSDLKNKSSHDIALMIKNAILSKI